MQLGAVAMLLDDQLGAGPKLAVADRAGTRCPTAVVSSIPVHMRHPRLEDLGLADAMILFILAGGVVNGILRALMRLQN